MSKLHQENQVLKNAQKQSETAITPEPDESLKVKISLRAARDEKGQNCTIAKKQLVNAIKTLSTNPSEYIFPQKLVK